VTTTTTTATSTSDRRSPTGRRPAPWLRRVLLLDTGVGLLSGVAVTALAVPLATELDTGTGLVVTLGLLFVLAGLVNGWAARDAARLPTLLAVDLDLVGAAVAIGVLVLASPTVVGAALLVLTALWTAGIAAIKLAGLRSARA
jgi:hypothetical protein